MDIPIGLLFRNGDHYRTWRSGQNDILHYKMRFLLDFGIRYSEISHLPVKIYLIAESTIPLFANVEK